MICKNFVGVKDIKTFLSSSYDLVSEIWIDLKDRIALNGNLAVPCSGKHKFIYTPTMVILMV